MNSGVRDGYRYFFVLCGGCAPGTPPVCERMRRFSQNPQKSQKKIINLLNQINLSEPHIPFCVICAICERIGGFSQKPQKSQKKIINLINQINLSEPHVVCDEGVLQYAPTGQG